MGGSSRNEETHCFIKSAARLFGSRSRTSDIQGHGMRDELVAFLPDVDGEFDLHSANISSLKAADNVFGCSDAEERAFARFSIPFDKSPAVRLGGRTLL